MKKISSVLLALTMLLALCVPAFAGDAVTAITHKGAKEIADSIASYIDSSLDGTNTANELLTDEANRKVMYKDYVAPALTGEDYASESYVKESISIAVTSLALDYDLDKTVTGTLSAELPKVIEEEFVGVEKFDKDDTKDVIADNFADSDLDSLFNTLKKTVKDLSGRVSGVLRGDAPGLPSKPDSKPSEQPEAGMQDPTGDTAVFAVLGVAAVAGAALVISKKKIVK